MNVNAYINFNGNCKQAIEYYAKVLDAPILMMATWGEMPMNATAETQNWIAHARIQVGSALLMASDSPNKTEVHGVSICVQTDTAADAERIFAALADGGKVDMPIEPTFFAERYGMCTDRFGVPWMVIKEMARG